LLVGTNIFIKKKVFRSGNLPLPLRTYNRPNKFILCQRTSNIISGVASIRTTSSRPCGPDYANQHTTTHALHTTQQQSCQK